MEIAVIVKAIKEIAGAVEAVFKAAKAVKEFFDEFDDSTREMYEAQMEAIRDTRDQILQASASILLAIVQVDERIFKTTMSDKLGDIDEAALNLDYSRRHNYEPVTKGLALSKSAGALADLLRLDETKAYPATSLVLQLSQILLGRLMILREADPGWCLSEEQRRPIEASISLIRSVTSQLEVAILAANQVKSTTSRRKVKRPIEGTEPPIYETVTITTVGFRYSNASGTVVFSESISTDEEGPEFEEAVEQLSKGANAARERGLSEDFINAALEFMRGIADQAEAALRSCEMRRIGDLAMGRQLNYIERALYKALRKTVGPVPAIATVLSSFDAPAEVGARLDPNAIADRAKKILTSPLEPATESALKVVAEQYGERAVVQLLLASRDSGIS